VKILVCGANGFIGNAIATRLERDGHEIMRGVRQPAHPGEVAIDHTTDLTANQWLERLDDVDVVINAVGILIERGAQTFERVHTQAPIALFTACRMRGVKQVIQISALGAGSRETPYFASKCAADDFLLAQPVLAHVIRPALVYGTDGTSARLFRTLASMPMHMLPAGGRQPLRPVHIDDLTELVARLLDPVAQREIPSCIEAVGQRVVSWRGMLHVYRTSMGLPDAYAISIPAWVMRTAAALGGRFAGSPLTSDTWWMLQRGNTADVQPFAQALGRPPRGIETFIGPDSAPAVRAEAFAAWRGLVLRIALAVVWIGTALVSAFGYPHAASLARLGRLGLHGTAANVALYGACVLDFVLGIATLLKPGRTLWFVQTAIVLAYTALIAVALPEFLVEPFGPILKNVPILAILILLFSEETRS
jgi:uncharacterized protein YbjT (DUF2867 family)